MNSVKKLIFVSLFMLIVNPAESNTEVFELSAKKDVLDLKVGRVNYRLRRVQEHQPHIKSLNIGMKCESAKVWIKYFYKFGMCDIKSAEFSPKIKKLKITYLSHDVDSGDNYLCEKTDKFLEFNLPDSCRPK